MIIKKIVTGIVALAIVSTMAVTTALATTSATKEVYGQSYAYSGKLGMQKYSK